MGSAVAQPERRVHLGARCRTRARRSDSGAALVEFALVVPVVVGLVFGMVDFGINLSNHISVRQGVREGARQAVVMAPDAETIAEIATLTKARIDVEPGRTRVHVVVEGVGDAVAGEPGSELTACAMVPMSSVSGIYSGILDGRTLTSKVTMRVEQELLWVDSGASGGDPAPAGGDWSWCSADG